MEPTYTEHHLPLRAAGFRTLPEALDYAALGQTGFNFYDGKGKLYEVLPYKLLREQAIALAYQFSQLGIERGSRVAIVADTRADFSRFFFACQYANLVPVPLPASIHLGSHQSYVEQLRGLLINCRPAVAIASDDFHLFLEEAAKGLDLTFLGTPAMFSQLPGEAVDLPLPESQDLAYIQYTSGSTRFPRGVVITQQMALSNLSGIIKDGLQVRPGDRCVSWLPFYHDMGLVGFVLGPVASQLSVDYLGTRDFAMRPRQWLNLMTRNRGTISFSPTFGYELCARRIRKEEVANFDLRSWRVAGVGAETIHANPMGKFADTLAPSGFNPQAFLACYGMAECALAISFAPLDQGLNVDHVNAEHLAESREALPVDSQMKSDSPQEKERITSFVNCGAPLPDYHVEVRDDQGHPLGERQCGTIFVKGPSIMSGYFGEPEATAEVLAHDGWLNTGDIGYCINEHLVITGRKKDLIIIHGRNIWPQDLECLAEQQPGLRSGDVSAFSVSSPHGVETAVLVIQCREFDHEKRNNLVERLKGQIHQELGIDCLIDLVPPHTLPRTSSGKLSRSGARQGFLKRKDWGHPLQQSASTIHETTTGACTGSVS
ncbi:MAG: fatty acyl-AMP ligase [Nitrospirales bacterium]|nr:fatty acyl-AMP ligase [Nitrospirales bacterium]